MEPSNNPQSDRQGTLQKAAAWFEQAPTYARTHWRLVAAIAAGFLLTSVLLLTYALRADTPEGNVAGATEEGLPTDARERALDGVFVHPSSTHLLPLGVMVENSADAWPLMGPAKANLVFEAPVEGSITRFLLFFDASTTVAELGPVRSARPYFVEWANGLQALYAHVGGSPAGLERVASLVSSVGFRDLNEFWNGWVFWRSSRRTAPHNVMTRTDLLLESAERDEYTAGSFRAWIYTDTPTSTEVTVATVPVPYQGIYRASWAYDADTGLYTRQYSTGETVRDADGAAVTATNVVLVLTDATVVDEIGRLQLRTTGSGKALIASRGTLREAEWSRRSGEHIQFTGIGGTAIPFARGTTWISVLTNADAFATISAEE